MQSEAVARPNLGAHRRRRRNLLAIAALAVAAAEYGAALLWTHNALPQLGLAALLAALLCGLSRLYTAGAAWLAAAALALAPVLPAYLPRHSAARPGCTLTVVNFNKEENPPDDRGAVRLLAGLHPDIVFAEKAYGPAQFANQLFAHGFAGYSSFANGSDTFILTRYPIIHSFLGRGVVAADILVESRTVRLLNMYVTRANLDRTAYLANYGALYREIAAQKGPLILAGDGNASAGTKEVRRLRTRLRDAWEEKGFGLGATFPGPWRRIGFFGPWLRIDYIFHNDAFDTAAVRRVDDAAGAGHYPVWAKLVLAGAGRPGEPCAASPDAARGAPRRER